MGSAKEFAGRVFTTAYMGTKNSSAETRQRAATLAAEVGAHHLDLNIDTVVAALTALFAAVTGRTPAFKVLFLNRRTCDRDNADKILHSSSFSTFWTLVSARVVCECGNLCWHKACQCSGTKS